MQIKRADLIAAADLIYEFAETSLESGAVAEAQALAVRLEEAAQRQQPLAAELSRPPMREGEREGGWEPSIAHGCSRPHGAGRGPKGRLRNFARMSDAKLESAARAIAREGNDLEAAEAVKAELASR